MKKNKLRHLPFLILSVVLAFSARGSYENSVKSDKLDKSKIRGLRPKLETSFKFTGSTLRGKFQTPLGLRAQVENDKLMDDLLQGRNNFVDRIEQDRLRN